MYCSLDKIDLAATLHGQPVALQTDHRTAREIEDEPELSALFAMTRVLNARAHLAAEGHAPGAVHYVVAGEAPPLLREALTATGAILEHVDGVGADRVEELGAPSASAASELADRSFAALARRAAAHVGVRDLAIALRMLEDATFAAPPARDDEPAYWTRVLELAALTGELLRARHPDVGRWVQTDRSLVPFGFQVSTGSGATIMFPTNRAQRAVEDGRDESLFKLLVATEEALEHPPDAATGRMMPSLRTKRSLELDEVIWRPLLPAHADADVPVIVYGIDGESTFGMIRRQLLEGDLEDAFEAARANLAAEPVAIEELHADEMILYAITGSYYAAEKLLDAAFLRRLHRELGVRRLAAAVPARGLLLVIAADAPVHLHRFAALARLRHDDSGGRALSPAVFLVEAGEVVGFVPETVPSPAPPPLRAEK